MNTSSIGGDAKAAYLRATAPPVFSTEKAAVASEVAHRIRVAIAGVPLRVATSALQQVMHQVDEQIQGRA
jgi:hypothetical protein